MSKLFIGSVTNAGFQMAPVAVRRDKLTGVPRAFGFVELAEGEDLQRAIRRSNGQSLDGRQLTVNEAPPQRTTLSRPGGEVVIAAAPTTDAITRSRGSQ